MAKLLITKVVETAIDLTKEKINEEEQKARMRILKKQAPKERYNPNNPAGHTRSQLFNHAQTTPKIGALVACSLAGGLFEHSGIYIGGNRIIEQHGDGYIKVVTCRSFLRNDRGFNLNINIQIACDSSGEPLAHEEVANRAMALYNDKERRLKPYCLLSNNCHQFCWHTICGDDSEALTTFSDLEQRVAQYSIL